MPRVPIAAAISITYLFLELLLFARASIFATPVLHYKKLQMAGRREFQTFDSATLSESSSLSPGQLEKAVEAIQYLSSLGLSTNANTTGASCSWGGGTSDGRSGNGSTTSNGASVDLRSGINVCVCVYTHVCWVPFL